MPVFLCYVMLCNGMDVECDQVSQSSNDQRSSIHRATEPRRTRRQDTEQNRTQKDTKAENPNVAFRVTGRCPCSLLALPHVSPPALSSLNFSPTVNMATTAQGSKRKRLEDADLSDSEPEQEVLSEDFAPSEEDDSDISFDAPAAVKRKPAAKGGAGSSEAALKRKITSLEAEVSAAQCRPEHRPLQPSGKAARGQRAKSSTSSPQGSHFRLEFWNRMVGVSGDCGVCVCLVLSPVCGAGRVTQGRNRKAQGRQGCPCPQPREAGRASREDPQEHAQDRQADHGEAYWSQQASM